jgi:hypothetical protein
MIRVESNHERARLMDGDRVLLEYRKCTQASSRSYSDSHFTSQLWEPSEPREATLVWMLPLHART